jgi:hypothetical protein
MHIMLSPIITIIIIIIINIVFIHVVGCGSGVRVGRRKHCEAPGSSLRLRREWRGDATIEDR